MTFTQEQVERIVIEVIRRLGLLNAGANPEVAVGERSSTTAELRLNEKVVSLRLLEGKLTGVTRVIVKQRAIITPAVKDELKARNIELIRTSP